ncbi:MAG: DUF452 family protein [Candidatus Gastranaerophilales bacterium]|nr:DUF452 family protein [Candidatus Gastranaerophilales bacterium]
MKCFYKNNKETDICLFFCGWGTDETPYMPVLKDMDYLIYYDYDKELSFEIPVDLAKYNKIYLLSFSAGGIMPALLKDKLPKFDLSVAVNASLRVDDKFGPSAESRKAMRGLNKYNYLEFRKEYLTSDEEELKLFNANPPRRSFESCFKELDTLDYYAEKYPDCTFDYDRVYVAENDRILPYSVQKEFWGDKIIKIKGQHFPFYKYVSLKEFFV